MVSNSLTLESRKVRSLGPELGLEQILGQFYFLLLIPFNSLKSSFQATFEAS